MKKIIAWLLVFLGIHFISKKRKRLIYEEAKLLVSRREFICKALCISSSEIPPLIALCS